MCKALDNAWLIPQGKGLVNFNKMKIAGATNLNLWKTQGKFARFIVTLWKVRYKSSKAKPCEIH